MFVIGQTTRFKTRFTVGKDAGALTSAIFLENNL